MEFVRRGRCHHCTSNTYIFPTVDTSWHNAAVQVVGSMTRYELPGYRYLGSLGWIATCIRVCSMPCVFLPGDIVRVLFLVHSRLQQQLLQWKSSSPRHDGPSMFPRSNAFQGGWFSHLHKTKLIKGHGIEAMVSR